MVDRRQSTRDECRHPAKHKFINSSPTTLRGGLHEAEDLGCVPELVSSGNPVYLAKRTLLTPRGSPLVPDSSKGNQTSGRLCGYIKRGKSHGFSCSHAVWTIILSRQEFFLVVGYCAEWNRQSCRILPPNPALMGSEGSITD